MKVACSASLLGCHFLNHSGLLDLLLREEKGTCKINVSRPLVSTSKMGCKVHLCHSPSSLWRWRIFSSSIGLLENQFILQFITSFEVFLLFLLFLSPCDVTLQKKHKQTLSLWGTVGKISVAHGYLYTWTCLAFLMALLITTMRHFTQHDLFLKMASYRNSVPNMALNLPMASVTDWVTLPVRCPFVSSEWTQEHLDNMMFPGR